MGEHIEHPVVPRAARKHSSKQVPETLLEIAIYDKCCRIGGTLSLDDLAETSEVGDWMMNQFRTACAASQEWLIVQDGLATAGLAAA
jgi:hypothetical protein